MLLLHSCFPGNPLQSEPEPEHMKDHWTLLPAQRMPGGTELGQWLKITHPLSQGCF